jgi:hypothetical protein
MSEVDANSGLLMDRGLPVGNSEDVFLRRALHVKVGNKPSEAIPVYQAPDEPGVETIIFEEGLTLVGGGTFDLINETVPANKVWSSKTIQVSCRHDAVFRYKVAGDTVGIQRTGVAQPTPPPFIFTPAVPIQEGDSIIVEVSTSAYVPETDVNATVLVIENNS